MLSVPLIGYMVNIFHSTVLVSNCEEETEGRGWVIVCFRQSAWKHENTCFGGSEMVAVKAVPGGPGAAREGVFW